MNKDKSILLCVVGCACAFAGFAISTGTVDVDGTIDSYKNTVNGSFMKEKLTTIKMEIEEKIEEIINPDPVQVSKVEGKAGAMQGLWSVSDGTCINPEDHVELVRQVYGAHADPYIAGFGLPQDPVHTRPIDKQFDPFKEKFGGVGTITYLQGGTSPWANLNQKLAWGDTSYMANSGCGPTGLSIIFSTMLQRYITPAEVIAARDTYSLRHPGDNVNGMRNQADGSGAMPQTSPDICKFVRDMKYNGQSLLDCSVGALDQAKVDATLDAGGMVLLVTHGYGATGYYWTGDGHYIVKRGKKDGMYYTADGSHDSDSRPKGNTDVPHPWSDLASSGHDSGTHYVIPGPGYEVYIQSIKE